jgi:hypothetical protein
MHSPASLNSIGNLPTPAPCSLSYPPQPRLGSIPPTDHRPASIPPTNNPVSRPPASMPPTNNPSSRPPASMPPSSPGTVQHRRPGTPPPVAVSSPSLSMAAAPRRNSTMIAVLLILDVGLAAAGGLMLMKGLAKPKAAEPAKAAPKVEPHNESHTEAAPPAPAATPVVVAAPPPPPAPIAPEPEKTVKKGKHAAVPEKKTGKGAAPLDPYGNAPAPAAPAVDQSQDIERMSAQSFGAFRSCLETAIQTQPIHGQIRISFLIEPDGHVDHTQAVVNTTGSDALASCLGQTISSWTFAPHPGPAASYERPFNYP